MTTEYTERHRLPSLGFLYDEELGIGDGEIEIKAMTTKDEKKLLGSPSDMFNDIVDGCIVNPDVDVRDLLVTDMHFLLMKLRILTYGSIYSIDYKCDVCGEKNSFDIDLDELEVYEIDDDFDEPFEIELPLCGDEVGLRLLRVKDNEKVRKRAKRLKKKSRGQVGNIEYILRLAKHLVTVNGEEVKPARKQGYIEDLIGRDSSYIKHKLNQIELGYDLTMYEGCNYCGSEFEFELPLGERFFRSEFRD